MIDIPAAIKLINDSEEDNVPKSVYENPELYLSLIKEGEDYASLPWLVSEYMPESLRRKNKDLMKQLVLHDPNVYEHLLAPLNDDKELAELAITSDVELFKYAGPAVKGDKAFVSKFLKMWLEKKPESLLPLSWIPLTLAKELKFIESANVKSMPAKKGYNRFVIQIEQEEVTEKKADAVLAKHEAFISAVIKDKGAELFDEIFQRNNSEEYESVETYAFLYFRNMTLEDLNDYFNNLAAKKVSKATTYVFDIENPNYMDYSGGEVSSGSIDSDEFDGDFDVYEKVIGPFNLKKWPIKILDQYQ